YPETARQCHPFPVRALSYFQLRIRSPSPRRAFCPLAIPTTAAGPQGPTGQDSNDISSFLVNGTPASLIYANLNGTISAVWRPMPHLGGSAGRSTKAASRPMSRQRRSSSATRFESFLTLREGP